MSLGVIIGSGWTGFTFGGGNVEDWRGIRASDAPESIPEGGTRSTVGDVIVVGDSIGVILDKIIVSDSTKNPRLVGDEVCLVWRWADQKIC